MKEPSSPVRADADRWTCPDTESMETEVADFVVAMVRMMKPDRVVELGTYTGILAQRIGEALRDEGRGSLDTFEISMVRAQQAEQRCAGLPVTIYHMDASSILPSNFAPVDMLIVDAARERRASDYVVWRQALAENGVALVHDTLKYNPPLEEVRRLPDEQVWFRTPRGLTLLQPNFTRPEL